MFLSAGEAWRPSPAILTRNDAGSIALAIYEAAANLVVARSTIEIPRAKFETMKKGIASKEFASAFYEAVIEIETVHIHILTRTIQSECYIMVE